MIPRLFRANKPIQSVVSFFGHARVETCRYLLSFNAGVSNSPVIPVDQIGLIENVGYRTKFGVFDELRGCRFGHRRYSEFHVANLRWLAQLCNEAQCPKQSPCGFMPPSELNPVVLGGGIIEYEAEFFGSQIWPEFV